MKVKLLKKVRKRFKILYYPNIRTAKLFDTEYYFSIRSSYKITEDVGYSSIDHAVDFLRRMIIIVLRDEYESFGRKRQAEKAYNNKSIQIWP